MLFMSFFIHAHNEAIIADKWKEVRLSWGLYPDRRVCSDR